MILRTFTHKIFTNLNKKKNCIQFERVKFKSKVMIDKGIF